MSPLNQPTWNDVYKTTPVEAMPWFSEHLDADFSAVLQNAPRPGMHLLDIGTGPGTQAIALAQMGFHVTATDISPIAISNAQQRAEQYGVQVDFRVDTILQTHLTGPFDYILDRGVFHTFVPADRPQYVDTVLRVLSAEGALLLKCFSHREPGHRGPYRLSPLDLHSYFEPSFECVSIADTTFAGNHESQQALFAVFSPHR